MRPCAKNGYGIRQCHWWFTQSDDPEIREEGRRFFAEEREFNDTVSAHVCDFFFNTNKVEELAEKRANKAARAQAREERRAAKEQKEQEAFVRLEENIKHNEKIMAKIEKLDKDYEDFYARYQEDTKESDQMLEDADKKIDKLRKLYEKKLAKLEAVYEKKQASLDKEWQDALDESDKLHNNYASVSSKYHEQTEELRKQLK